MSVAKRFLHSCTDPAGPRATDTDPIRFADALDATIEFPAESLDGLAAKIPVALLEETLKCAGVTTVRMRRLDIQQVASSKQLPGYGPAFYHRPFS